MPYRDTDQQADGTGLPQPGEKLPCAVPAPGDSVMLVHFAHHDHAYKWAERRRIEAHPKTGALQIVEVRELVEEPPKACSLQPELALETPAIWATTAVPVDWLAEVRRAGEDRFFAIAGHLPSEASEALLEFAATRHLSPKPPPTADPLKHPDTLRRFRVLEDAEELQAALDASFEKWLVFLHPTQKVIVPARPGWPVRPHRQDRGCPAPRLPPAPDRP